MTIVTVSSKGQIVIPQQVRKRLNLKRGAKVEVVLRGNVVELQRVRAEERRDWGRWRGALRGTGVLRELESEHAQEIARGR